MCGIFGAIAKEGKKIKIPKIKSLGLYNIKRGVHSCGYYYNGNIDKGVNNLKDFGDFVVRKGLHPGKALHDLFIGHTRHATFGVHSYDNAHPHLINDRYVQAHNGTIHNWEKLLKNHGIDKKGIDLDSIALAKIIEKDGWEVLKDYDGAAALAMTFVAEPDTLYLYHGASRAKHGADVEEERPMYILDTPEALYFSSIRESLQFINTGKAEVVTLPWNKVFKIVKGEIKEAVHTVEREDSNLWIAPVVETNFKNYYTGTNTNNQQGKLFDITKESSIILKESYPAEFGTQEVFYRMGRFFRGELTILNGMYEISRKGNIKGSETQIGALEKNPHYEKYWFIRGAMMLDQAAFDECIKNHPDIMVDIDGNFAWIVSAYSRYPVTFLEHEGRRVASKFHKVFFKDKKVFTGTYDVKWTKRKYTIKKGLLHEIEPSPDEKGMGGVWKQVKPDAKLKIHIEGEENEKDNMRDELIEVINQWCNKVIKDDEINMLPEPFLLFIDYSLMTVFNLESNKKVELSDNDLEIQTSMFLNAIMQKKATVAENFEQEGYTDLITREEIRSELKEYETDELLQMENRYWYVAFQDHVAEYNKLVYPIGIPIETKKDDGPNYADAHDVEIQGGFPEFGESSSPPGTIGDINTTADDIDEEREAAEKEFKRDQESQRVQAYLKKIEEQLKDMSLLADQLQEYNESDAAQDIAYNVYHFKDDLSTKIKTVLNQGYANLGLKF